MSTHGNEEIGRPSSDVRIGQIVVSTTVLEEPDILSLPGSWVEHIPFAFWLIRALRPRTLVELGTHSGNSYFAFCQAIRAAGIDARAFAIDTWKGDEHAGYYSEEIFSSFKIHNERYSKFSTYIRRTFDDAIDLFADGEIDLLHVDGLHSYDAVRHDFDAWKSKLSDRGVVLFHDISVKDLGFGVYRLWEELHRQYPSFAFVHGNGLGILGVGQAIPLEVAKLFGSDEAETVDTRSFFASVGRVASAALDRQTENQRRGEEFARLSELTTHYEALARENANLRKDAGALEERIGTLEGDRDRLQGEANDLRHSFEAASRETSILSDELSQARVALSTATAERNQAELAINAAHSSEVARIRRDHKEEVAKLEARNGSSLADAENSRALLAVSQDRLSAAEDLLKSSEAELAGVRQVLEVASQDRQRLSSSLEDERKVFRAKERGLSRRVDSLQASVADLGNARDSLAREKDSAVQLHRTAVTTFSRYLTISSSKNTLSVRGSIRSFAKSVANFMSARRRERAKTIAALRASGYFDYRFYLETYEDVAAKGLDPLEHFVTSGCREGRRPNQWFDPTWYSRVYPDVARAQVNPLMHYVSHGAAEGRWPSAGFDPGKYLSDHPDVASAGAEALHHMINFGQFEGRLVAVAASAPSPDPHFLETASVRDVGFVTEELPAHGEMSTKSLFPSSLDVVEITPLRISIIVPVYGDRELTLKCLESVLRSIPSNRSFQQLIIIDDLGPDQALRDSLKIYATIPGVSLHTNDSNLGFVRSTNRGIGLSEKDDVVLLNSDTEVHGDWLDRLAAHTQDPQVGTITPLSNNATICSFPDIGGSSTLMLGTDLATVDAMAASINRGRSVQVPTGVGFCMYIKRAALEECGLLDEEAFGAGYGEETDFCQRIQARGWRNLLATDIFVYHAGGASFGASSNSRKDKAGAIMRDRFPEYEPSVARWITSDPAFPMRLALEFALVREKRPTTILHITHPWGGGVERHIRDLEVETSAHAAHAIAMLGGIDSGIFELKLMLPDGVGRWRQFIFKIRTAGAVADIIRALGPTKIHVHHGLPEMSFIRSVLIAANLSYDITIHDYWPICARMNLSVDGEYCGEPDEFACLSCLAKTEHLAGQDVIAWRERSGALLQGADRVIAPSLDVARRIEKRFPDAPPPIVAPHELDHYRPLSREVMPRLRKSGEPFRIVAVGAFNSTKGGGFLLDVIEAGERLGLNFGWLVVGYFYPPYDERAKGLSSLVCTGPYDSNDVDGLLRAGKTDLAFFPQRIPETYSYTLTEVFKVGLPTLTCNIGAFVERVEGVPGSWTYNPSESPESVALKLSEIRRLLSNEGKIGGDIVDDHSRTRFYRDEYLRPKLSASIRPE